MEGIFDIDEANSSPSFSPGPVAILSSPPTKTKSGRKSTPRKRKATVGNVAYVSPPVKAARHQLTAAEIRHNGKLDEPVKEARSQLTAAEIRHNGKLEGAWKNILGIGVVFIFSWVAIDTTNSWCPDNSI